MTNHLQQKEIWSGLCPDDARDPEDGINQDFDETGVHFKGVYIDLGFENGAFQMDRIYLERISGE